MPFALFDPRLAALVVGLLGPAETVADLPSDAEVVVERLDVFDEPDAASFASDRLRRGDRVTVREVEDHGWLIIDPPPTSFCWIDSSAIRVEGGSSDEARVVVPRTQVRSGHPNARMPGSPRLALIRDSVVRLLDRPPLVLGSGPSKQTWRAIAPPQGEVRHIRADGIVRISGPPPRAQTQPIPEVRAIFAPPDGEGSRAPEVAAEIMVIEADHRALLRGPIEQWRLGPIRQRYETLLLKVSDTDSGHAIRARLDQLAQQEEAAQAARTIQTILDQSRRRDRELALFRRRLAALEQPRERPYDAEGLVQPSSRQVEGQKVFALIGPEGTTLAYLDVPPGLDARPLVARRVGVRGTVHYSENLRARLISVRDLEPLDDDR